MKAEKMKIFVTAKENFISMDLDANKRTFHLKQSLHILHGFTATVLQFLYILFDANTPREYMNSILNSTIGILCHLAYWSVIFKTTSIYNFIDRCETIINGRLKYPIPKSIYTTTNEISEKLCKILQIFILYVAVPGFVLPKAFYCFFLYFTTDLGSDAFELPFPTWFPFDWTNPTGYLIAILLQIRMVAIPLRFIGCFATFGFTCFLFSMSVTKDLKNEICAINENARKKRTRLHIHGQFIEFVRFMKVKRLLSIFFEIYQIILTILFLGVFGIILLALLMIQIDLAQMDNEVDLLVLFESCCLGFGSLILILVTCELGQRFTNAFSEVDDDLILLNFHLLPLNIRRILPIILMYSHEPLVVRFFGSLSVTRDQFKRMIGTVYQYFMILREFNY